MVGFLPRQQGSDDPRILVCQGHGGPVLASLLGNPPDPAAARVLFVFAQHRLNHRPSTVDQEGAKVRITPFADAQQAYLAAGPVLARHQPERRREMNFGAMSRTSCPRWVISRAQ